MDESVWKRGVAPRALTAIVTTCVALTSGVAQAQAPVRTSASALLAVDQNRATVIDRVVAQWSEPLAQSSAALGAEQLRAMLAELRADHLLAASLAGTLEGLRNALATAATSTAAVREGLLRSKALGDVAADLVYTPINPCRIVDTRLGGGGFMGTATARDWNVSRPGGSFGDQGGASGDCAIPTGPAAVLANLTVTESSQPGVLYASAFSTPDPVASALNWAGGQTIANAVIVPVATGQPKELHVFVSAATHVVIDVLGYFKAPGGPGNYFVQGGNAFGVPAVIGAIDAQPVKVTSGGGNIQLDVGNGDGLRILNNAESAPDTINGHADNRIVSCVFGIDAGCTSLAPRPTGATIAGGGSAAGFWNGVHDDSGTVGGGALNRAGTRNGDPSDAAYATVAGGLGNSATSTFSTIGGGQSNEASHLWSTVAGGLVNMAQGPYSAIGGGEGNRANGHYSVVPGGNGNTAAGYSSFAAGTRARALADGCFVWGDSSTFSVIECGVTNATVFRSLGGFYIATAGNAVGNYTGALLPPGSASWSTFSDRDAKQHIEPVDGRAVLRRLVGTPVSTWSWKSQDGRIRHMGPMAQDFYAAFGLGEDAKRISTVDADGVALAAIQGLHAELQRSDALLARQSAEVSELRKTVEALQRAVASLTDLR